MFRLDFSKPIYLGTADNALQEDAELSQQSLTLEVTVLSVLGYIPIVGTPFIWQSAATLGAIEKRRELLDLEGGLKLGGRPNVTNASEYFRQRDNDTSAANHLILRNHSAFRSEKPGAIPLDWHRNIAPDVRVDPRPGSVEKYFRALFIDDTQAISAPGSVMESTSKGYGGKYSRAGKTRTDRLLNEIGEKAYGGHFSRAMVEHSYLSGDAYFTNLDEVLARTSALYQAANGLAHEGVLFTTPSILKRIPNHINLTVLGRFSISPLNPYLFADVLSVLGVQKVAWVNIPSLVVAQIMNTVNPLRIFIELYTQFLVQKIFYWANMGWNPAYLEVVKQLRKALFYDDEWQFMEKLAFLSNRKFDGLAAGVSVGFGAATLGQNPLMFGGAARQVVEYGYRFIEGLTFFEVMRMRSTLKKYLHELGLL